MHTDWRRLVAQLHSRNHPTIRIAGKDEFVLLPIGEYRKWQEALEDASDLTAMRKARRVNAKHPTMTIQQLKERLGYARKRTTSK